MMKYFLLISLTFLSFHLLTAQNSVSKSPEPRAVYLTNPLEISVTNNAPVENFLVVISDSAGQTIFLDNRFHLTGSYIKSVDLSRSGRGPYILCIAKDADKTYTRFYLK